LEHEALAREDEGLDSRFDGGAAHAGIFADAWRAVQAPARPPFSCFVHSVRTRSVDFARACEMVKERYI
jgi:hypothetical protein